MTSEKDPQVRMVVRPTGNPLPLGFLGLAVATTLFSALQLDWLDASQGAVAAMTVLSFTVPVQLIASVFGFLARDSIAGTGMALLAGTWTTVGTVTLTSPPGATSAGLGVLLVTAGIAMTVPAIPAWRMKLVPAAVMTISALRFAVTGVYELTASAVWETVAGSIGLLLAVVAFYAALALEFEDSRGRTVLPIGRLGSGRGALSASATAQFEQIGSEAGVRRQL